MRLRLQMILMGLLMVSACGGGSDGAGPGAVVPPPTTTVPTVAVQRVFTQLQPSFIQPLSLQQAPGDSSRWFVVEKNGFVRVFANDQNTSSASVFLDINTIVDAAGEGGLLGIAFDPGFPVTPEVYVSYTRTGSPLVSHVSRFTSTDNGLTLNAGTEEVIFTVLQDQTNHNGGNIVFGPDGNLYIGFGDGGGGGDPLEKAQDTSNLLGTMVRIDISGAAPFVIPAGNPFSGNAVCTQGNGAAPCPEIFAWGLRNPWRFSFDTVTNKLWAGDVGQSAFEEIDVIEAGLNYGWDEREGPICFEPVSGCATGFAEPITSYDRTLGQSVTGGFVYRGAAIAELVGWYVFGDFSSGRLFAIPEASAVGVTADDLGTTGLAIASFGQGVDGELYIVDIGGGGIYQIVDAP